MVRAVRRRKPTKDAGVAGFAGFANGSKHTIAGAALVAFLAAAVYAAFAARSNGSRQAFGAGDALAAERSIGFDSLEQWSVVQKWSKLPRGASRDATHFRPAAHEYFDVNQYEGFRVPTPEHAQDASVGGCELRNGIPTADEFFARYVSQRRPVIIRSGNGTVDGAGAGRDAPAGFHELGWSTHKWSDEYMLRRAGHMMVEVEAVMESEDPVQRFGSNYVDVTFRDFLSSLRESGTGTRHGAQSMYLNVQNLKAQGQVVPDFVAAFEHDFKRDLPFVGNLRLHEINAWLGDVKAHAASTSPLHYDPYDNVYALLRGRKRFKIFSPGDAHLLYPKHRLDHVSPEGLYARTNNFPVASFSEQRQSAGWAGRRAAELFPRFAGATAAECELEPGDLLYLPAGWFHEVTSLPTSHPRGGEGEGGTQYATRHMALNFWYDPPHRGATPSDPYSLGPGLEQPMDTALRCYDRAFRAFFAQRHRDEIQRFATSPHRHLLAFGSLHRPRETEAQVDDDQDAAEPSKHPPRAVERVVHAVEACALGPLDSPFEHLHRATLAQREPLYAAAGLALRRLARAHRSRHRPESVQGTDVLANHRPAGRWANDGDKLWLALGQLKGMSSAWAACVKMLRKAEAEAPIRTQTQFFLGRALAELGHHKEAARAFAMCVTLEPRKVMCWRKLAAQLIAIGDESARADASIASARADEIDKEDAEFTDV